MVMPGQSDSLTALFLGRFRPLKRLTSTKCTYFRQLLTTALLGLAEGETKAKWPDKVSNPGPLVPDCVYFCVIHSCYIRLSILIFENPAYQQSVFGLRFAIASRIILLASLVVYSSSSHCHTD